MANNKVCGPATDFTLVKEEGTRTVISYGLKVEEGNELAIWRELYFPKKQGRPSFDAAKAAILNDINARTDEKILKGFVWNEKPVWLSSENQFNFKAAYDLAVQTDGANLPVTFKLGELSDGTPVYHTFEEMAEAQDFYVKAVTFINQTLAAGWQRKDSIDWDAYAAALDPEYTPKKKTTKK
jgi:hypothetical protein